MKYLKQFTVILGVSFVGELLHALLPLPIPAGIYGIVLMFLLLLTGAVKLGSVKDAADFLIEIMPVMFIPAAVGLMDAWGLVADNWLAYLVITFFVTFIVMAATGLSSGAVVRLKKKKSEKADLKEKEVTEK